MEDEELIALKNLRKELLMKSCNLIEQLKKQERNELIVVRREEPCTIGNTSNIQPCIAKNTNKINKKAAMYEHMLCEITQRISGLTFENVDRKWVKSNFYQYTAFIVTKLMTFHIELLVKLKDEEEFEISGIKCDYININRCYILEIDSWVQNMTKMNNFSFLTSAMSYYIEQSMIRKTIIDNLKAAKYISNEPCTEDNGGILIYVHPPENVQQMYLKIRWTILFLERIWKHEHYFSVNTLQAGHSFAKENLKLLEEFCKPSLTKQNLIDMWKKLCSAVDLYEDRNENEIDNDSE